VNKQNLTNEVNDTANIPSTVLGSSGKAANSTVPENSKAFVSGVVFSPSLSKSIAESKRQWAAEVLATNQLSSEVPSTELVRDSCPTSACPDVVVTLPRSPIRAIAADAQPGGKVEVPVAVDASVNSAKRVHAPADDVPSSNMGTKMVHACNASMHNLARCTSAGCIPAAELALDVASGGEPIHVGRCSSPLRSPRVSRSGGSPHAGTTPPRSSSTPLRAGSPSYEAVASLVENRAFVFFFASKGICTGWLKNPD
jgi:hypothetical protein